MPQGIWAASPTGAVGGAGFGAVPAGLAAHEEVGSDDEEYWRENHFGQPYGLDAPYDTYASAYRLGAVAYARYGRAGADYDSLTAGLQGEYAEGGSPLTWDKAEPAVRAAWDRSRNLWAAR